MKVVINSCYGGFGVSQEGLQWLVDNKHWSTGFGALLEKDDNKETLYLTDRDAVDLRTNKNLIEMIETLGKIANAQFANLKVIEVPDDVEFEIEEYDGLEHIAEKHRTWS